MTDEAKCELCGEPMPPGEEMFKFHGYSGPCPKEPKSDAAYKPDDTTQAASNHPQWHAQPPRHGLYLYANKPKDWDISEPVGVSRIDYCDGKGEFLTANYRRERVLVAEMPGIWWGPLPTPTHATKPGPELEAKA